MKFLILLFFLTACSSFSKNSFNYFNSYEGAKSFRIGQDSKSDIQKKMGIPFNEISNNESDILVYVDPSTDLQRYSFSFSKKSGLLTNVLWMPSSKDKEKTLQFTKELFKDARFEETVEKVRYHQAIPTESTLTDRKNGISILYDIPTKSVQAISFSENESRLPADLKK